MTTQTQAPEKAPALDPDPSLRPAKLRYVQTSQLRLDGGTQMRLKSDLDARDEYRRIVAQDYERAQEEAGPLGDVLACFKPTLPPLCAVYDGDYYWLWDGFNRRHAYIDENIPAVPVLVTEGTQQDAVVLAAGANAAHGVRRSDADKRRAVQALFDLAEENADDPFWKNISNNKIAKLARVSSTLVDTMRHEQITALPQGEPTEDEKEFLRELQATVPALYWKVKKGELTIQQAQQKLLERKNGLSNSARETVRSAPDTKSAAPPEPPSRTGSTATASAPEESDEEWLEKLPLWLVLKGMVHRGYAVRDDLLAYRAMEKASAWTNFAYHSTRLCDLKDGGVTPFARLVAGVTYLPRPQDWKVCSPCQGEGCEKCGYAGYDPHTGIDPTRMLGVGSDD